MRPIVDIKSKCFEITDRIIGTGAFSLVKIAFIKVLTLEIDVNKCEIYLFQGNKTPIALKICHCNCESEWYQSLNEICLLKKLIHPNIAKLNNYEITRL